MQADVCLSQSFAPSRRRQAEAGAKNCCWIILVLFLIGCVDNLWLFLKEYWLQTIAFTVVASIFVAVGYWLVTWLLACCHPVSSDTQPIGPQLFRMRNYDPLIEGDDIETAIKKEKKKGKKKGGGKKEKKENRKGKKGGEEVEIPPPVMPSAPPMPADIFSGGDVAADTFSIGTFFGDRGEDAIVVAQADLFKQISWESLAMEKQMVEREKKTNAAAAAQAEVTYAECVICLTRRATHAINPCGHRCLCQDCVPAVHVQASCPICRKDVESILHIFD